eukprot:g26.t1
MRRTMTLCAAKSKPTAVILGSGWGGFECARRLDKEKWKVIVVSPANHFLFTPLLPSTAVGTLEFRCIQEPIRTIPGVHYDYAKARDIDFVQKQILCSPPQTRFPQQQSFTVDYDKLILSFGMKTHTFGIPGVMENEGHSVFYLKHLHHAKQIRSRIISCAERASIPGATDEEKRRLLTFVIVGGGPTSVEFAGELHDFLAKDLTRWYPEFAHLFSIHLIEAGGSLLSSFEMSLQSYALQQLEKKKYLNIKLGTSVKEIESKELVESFKTGGTSVAVLSNGERIQFGAMIWSAGLTPIKLIDAPGFKNIAKNHGRLLIDSSCRLLLENHHRPDNENIESNRQHNKHLHDVFAIGDCAVNSDAPLPQIAQAAQQQGRYVATMLNSADDKDASNKEFKIFSLGAMASLGLFDGVLDASKVGDLGTAQGGTKKIGTLAGISAFLAWRTVYWGRQFIQSSTSFVFYHLGQILNAASGPFFMGATSRLSCVWFDESERTTATACATTANGLGTSIGFLLPFVLDISELFYVSLGLSLIPLISLFHLPPRPRYPPSAAAKVSASLENSNVSKSHSESLEDPNVSELSTSLENPTVSTSHSLTSYWMMESIPVKNGSFIALCTAAAVLSGVSSGWQGVFQSTLAPAGISTNMIPWLGFGNSVAENIGAVLVASIIDIFFQRHLKAGLLFGLVGCFLATAWFMFQLPLSDTIHSTGLMPRSTGTILSAIIASGLFQGATSPLFYELAAEIIYPLKEGASGSLIVLILNISSGIVILSNNVLSSGPINIVMTASVLLVLLVVLLGVTETYKRPRTRA